MATELDTTPIADYFLDSADGKFEVGKTLSTVNDVARILDKAVGSEPESGLVIHFHGGLISKKYALEKIVPSLAKTYLDSAKAYPLFFVWESGLRETLINNKDELLKDPTFRELVKKVTEFAIKKSSFQNQFTFRGPEGTPLHDEDNFRKHFDEWFDGNLEAPPVPDAGPTTGIALAPELVVHRDGVINEDELELEIEESIEDDEDFKKAFGAAYNALVPATEVAIRAATTGTTERATKVLFSETALDELFPPPPGAAPGVKTRGIFTWAKVLKFVTKIVLAVLRRFRNDRDHGVYCTVVEEVLRSAYIDLLGSNVWNQMKNDTEDSFLGGEACGTAVIAKLQELQDKGLNKVTLVGHSTGAIYICNFLDAAKRANLNFETWQVVFLAPAVTCKRFARAIQEHGNDRLINFRMYAMTDELESQDKLVPILYTRSLLYLVSGVLEGVPKGTGWEGILDMPLVGMQRFVDGNKTFASDEEVKTVHDFLHSADHPHRVVWSPTRGAGAGLNSTSEKHGDFDDDELTLDSVAQFIRG